MGRPSLVAIAIGIGFGLFPHASSANSFQRHTYPGLFCVERNAPTSPDIRFNENGAAENMSGSTKDIHCPTVMALDAVNAYDWHVTAYRSSAAYNTAWNIGLWLNNDIGTAGYVTTVNVPIGSGYKGMASTSTLPNYSTFSNAQLTVFTSLPTGCRLHSYEIREQFLP